ncbi:MULTISPECIES: response regulator [Pseudanabaena]|uniref:response regulator n=1 Tax=Pseudanabaena TaxID=1152 RepID=UPI00247A68C0|nr:MULTISPECIES: response regulator [Pseudanabaena]MEA5488407.1 response regulator [Pseudanabaena sp. CCNP1317]WGS70387.1 response regulator [Pseudanabaena galeata CCNP1313]
MQANAIDVSQSKILVVDNDPDIRHELASALKKHGYIVKTAGDSSDALLYVQSHPPDLILLNIFLPQISGYEVARILKADTITENIPIIFTSIHDDIAAKLQAFESGGSDFIVVKLSQLAELFARVHLHLSLRHLQIHLAQKNQELSHAVFDRVGMLKDLQRTNLLLHAQKEAVIDGILAVDEQGRIVSFNRRFCEMWNIPHNLFMGDGLEPEFHNGSPLGTFFIKSDLPEVLINLIETTYDDPDVVRHGEIIYGDRVFDYYTSPVSSEQNKFFGLIWCFRDITAKKQADLLQMQLMEDLRKAKDEAEEAVRTKAAFLAMMSHEIRTPINGVIGMTQLLAGTDLNNEQNKFVRTIQVSGEMLLSVINDILDFSKIESGKLELESVALDVRALVRDIYDVQLSKAKEKSLKFEVSMHTYVPPFIVGDVTRLRQILLNLVSNALKFTDTGSVRIGVRLASDQVPNPDQPFQLLFSVTDTGIGITDEQRQRLFQPFSQATATTARKYGGTGLGLVICKNLVETMGGKIQVESKTNQGSTFSFTITTQIAKERPSYTLQDAMNKSISTGSRLGDRVPLKILIAEDNLINQELAMAMLIKMGYQPDVVDNGLAVLEALQVNRYDLLLLDVQMPEMDGLETASHLVNHWHDLHTGYERPTIIAMTASAMQGDREMCLRAGMDDYISKPIMMDSLQRTIEKWAVGEQINEADAINTVAKDMSSSVIDPAAIKNLQQINPKLIGRMINLFTIEEAPVLLKNLRQAIANNDLQEVSYNAHTLKGSSNILGAKALGKLCLEVELKGKREDSVGLPDLFAQIEQQYQIACQELAKL